MTLLMIGTTEWIIIALVILLLFGGAKLPELMRGLGKGLKEFKDATKDATKDISKEATEAKPEEEKKEEEKKD